MTYNLKEPSNRSHPISGEYTTADGYGVATVSRIDKITGLNMALLQKRPIILSTLLTEATPYVLSVLIDVDERNMAITCNHKTNCQWASWCCPIVGTRSRGGGNTRGYDALTFVGVEFSVETVIHALCTLRERMRRVKVRAKKSKRVCEKSERESEEE